MRPRVHLVDDDTAMRLFVEMALDGLDIEFGSSRTVSDAVVALRAAPPALVIVDLMLPGESGLALLERMQADPKGLGAARTVVASAAADTPGVAEPLRRLGVWRVLCKPLRLETLVAAVREGLDAPRGPAAGSAGTPGTTGLAAPEAATAFFGGDEALYRSFLAACRSQFAHDIAAGDRALAAVDLPGLQRLAHNLKTVMQTLGESHAMACAAALEREASQRAGGAPARWAELRRALVDLAGPV